MVGDGSFAGEPHDVLAADEFAFPAGADAVSPLRLPDDPTGIEEPHDVLAAEEFAMPAGADRGGSGVAAHAQRNAAPLALLVLAVLIWLLRRR